MLLSHSAGLVFVANPPQTTSSTRQTTYVSLAAFKKRWSRGYDGEEDNSKKSSMGVFFLTLQSRSRLAVVWLPILTIANSKNGPRIPQKPGIHQIDSLMFSMIQNYSRIYRIYRMTTGPPH